MSPTVSEAMRKPPSQTIFFGHDVPKDHLTLAGYLWLAVYLGVPVVISHHKVTPAHNHGRTVQTLAHLRGAMQHQCVALDCYPYTAGSTMIRADRALMGGRMVIASSQPHPECVGREIAEIAADWGVPRDEAARRLQPGSAIYFLMDEADVEHDGAKVLITELENGAPEDDYYDAKVKVLSEGIKHHVKEEEGTEHR